MVQKRIAVLHDLSCFGKCSLTVALPILSAATIETAVIPTAVLSTHTGGFGKPYIRDLSEGILPIVEHWRRENLSFDAIFTGYLCSSEQVELVLKAITQISRPDTLLVTDPCFADHGILYRGFPADFPQKMLTVCRAADIITPNVTEAAMLTGKDVQPEYTRNDVEALLSALYELTGAQIVLTGVSFEERKIGAAVYDGSQIDFVFTGKLRQMAHGTGDIFASTLIAALLNGKSLRSAAQVAVNFTRDCIKKTMENGTEERLGVDFETQLPHLLRYLNG